jgi:hypothetical protein
MSTDFPSGLGQSTYEFDYYCGSNVLTYFEDILVDDIVRIAWSVQQNRTPIWGYASQYFNALASGVIIGGGSFWIAFKEAGYIPIILRHLSERRDPDDPFYSSPAVTPRSGREESSGLVQSAQTWEGTYDFGDARRAGRASRENIERMTRREAQTPDDADAQAASTRYAVQLAAMNDRDFENEAEMFEDAIWYGGNSAHNGRSDVLSGNYNGGELSDETFETLRRADQFPPYDIIVTFGDMNNSAANHTVVRLMDVTITNTQFVGIEPTGEPIIVQYDFLCRAIM